MKTMLLSLASILMLCGCGGLRLPASEAQKENAWLHWRTTQLAADTAKAEETSGTLQGLTSLSHQQSEAFVADAGVPKQIPAQADAETILASAPAVALQAKDDAARRIDPWAAADGVLDAGIGIAGLLGGAWGLKAMQFLKNAREKTVALKEIVEGNELFKQVNKEAVGSFKEAHNGQSAATQRIVTELRKAG